MRSITLSWPQPEQPNGIILDYEIRYYEKVSQPCLQACKTQGQPLFHGWWSAEVPGRQAGGSPEWGRNLVTQIRGSLSVLPALPQKRPPKPRHFLYQLKREPSNPAVCTTHWAVMDGQD